MIFTRDSSKDVPFGGLNDVPLNFVGKTPKTEILGAWIGLSSLNDKKFKSLWLENYLAGHDEIFKGSTHHEWAFMGRPMALQQIQDGGGRHL